MVEEDCVEDVVFVPVVVLELLCCVVLFTLSIAPDALLAFAIFFFKLAICVGSVFIPFCAF